MDLERKKMQDLIEALNQNNIQILEVYDPDNRKDTLRYFKTSVFRPADGNTLFHSLSLGVDITQILDAQSSLFANTPNFIRQVITAIENQQDKRFNRDFSGEWRWVWYK
jgi:hypothetical protein